MRSLVSFRLAMIPLALLLLAGAAQAHFAWVDLGGTGDKPVGLYFSDSASPDAARLLDRLQDTQLFVRDAEGEYHPLEMEKQIDGEQGKWIAGPQGDKQVTHWNVVEAISDYGVAEHGGETFRLFYDAKYLNRDALATPDLTSSEKLTLDIVSTLAEGKLRLEVRAEGKPLAGAEVVIHDAEENKTTVETDAEGIVVVDEPQEGRYHIRARHVQETAGEQDGKKFDSVRRYSTLVLDLGDTAQARSASLRSATQMLEQTREARAVWDDFPGFTSKVSIRVDDQSVAGTMTVDAYGRIATEGFDLKDHPSVRTILRSMVSHRMPGEPASTEADFDESYAENPLGTMIRLRGDGMGSHYRLKEDVVTEVNRKSANGRFTISVLSVHRNPEGKYLPEVFSVDTWNSEGDLTGSTTHLHEWVRVGDFDLPEELTVVSSGKDRRTVTRIQWDDHRLLEE